MKYNDELFGEYIKMRSNIDRDEMKKIYSKILYGKKWNLEDEDERKKLEDITIHKQFDYLYKKYGDIRKNKTKIKKDDLTPKQSKALKKLEKVNNDIEIKPTDYKKAINHIKKNKSVKVYAEELVFSFVGDKKGGSLSENCIIIHGKGIGDNNNSSSDEDNNIDFDALPNIEDMIIKDDEWRGLSIDDIIHRYNILKAYIENSNDDIQLPDEPAPEGEGNNKYKAKLKRFYNNIIKKDEIKNIINEGQEWMKEKKGKGMKQQKERIHIDINSHNVKNGRYKMGDGILDNMDDTDLAKIHSLMNMYKSNKPKNILEGIEQKDISKLMKTIQAYNEGYQKDIHSIEMTRKAVKERMKRDMKPSKTDKRFITEKITADEFNKKFKKGSKEMKDKMTRLRAMRKNKI